MKMILEASAKVFLLGICAFSLTNCFNGHVRKAQDANASVSYIPEAPDYDDSIMWITADGDQHGTGADVFYVVSTWEEDWMTADSIVCLADLNITCLADGDRTCGSCHNCGAADCKCCNDCCCKDLSDNALLHVCAAFDYFQAQRDQSRPLIIAGFSQGGMAVVELLKHMSDETYGQLAAAYVLGYKVTPEDTLQTKHIKAAQGADDTGVTICYNTVKDVKYINSIIAASCIGINPVNWRTDATPATLHDTITVTLEPERHVLVVTGYSGSEYQAYKNFINVGDIHSCEPWLYSECIKKNMALRAKAWRMRN